MNAKKAKLEEQFAKDVDKAGGEKAGIFSGIAIFVNGYTNPTADELKRIMMMNGGIFHHYQSATKTTHIIAANLPDTKVKALKGNEKICTPNWITESLTAGKLLDYTNYLLFSNVSKTQPKLTFANTKAKDAKDANFLGEFYSNSRLHHISTMGASFKDYVNQLRSKHNGDFSEGRKKLKNILVRETEGGRSSLAGKNCDFAENTKCKQVIMHIDMDCFFVSVGLRKYPQYRGHPVAVTHSKGGSSNRHNQESLEIEMAEYEKRLRKKCETEVAKQKVATIADSAAVSMSEIASCSYEARSCGVKNGMFMGAALKLCPNLKTIPYDFDSYQQVANTLYDTVAQYTLDIQAVSCDEMLVDLSDVLADCDTSISPEDFAAHLRSEIEELTDCNASVGLGSSILLARTATRKAKPNGVFHLNDNLVHDFIKEVQVTDLPGIGRTNSHKFKTMGVENCGQLQAISLDQLKHEFGPKLGQALFNYCRGIDTRTISFDHERKSVSVEVNYGIRFSTVDEMERFLGQLCDEVALRLAKANDAKGRQITLKIMVRSQNAPEETAKFLGHGLCDSFSKGSTLSHPTSDSNVIKREVMLLMKMLKTDPKDLRGIGIQVGKLEKNDNKGSSTPSILGFLSKSPTKMTKSRPSTSSKEAPDPFDEIDEDVLKELPDEIRKEIEEERAKRGSTNCLKPRPMKEKKMEDLSFSQLDESVLAQLPESIVKELEQDFKSRAQTRRASACSAFDSIMQQPSNSSPDKVKTKKRGRPAKNSPRFIKKSKPKDQPVTNLAKKALDFTASVKDDVIEVTAEEKEEATLNGASDVDEIRALLREWTRSTDCPTNEDTQIVIDFFSKSIVNGRSEVAYQILKSFGRFCQLANHSNWSFAFNQVMTNVQSTFKACNNGKKLYVTF